MHYEEKKSYLRSYCHIVCLNIWQTLNNFSPFLFFVTRSTTISNVFITKSATVFKTLWNFFVRHFVEHFEHSNFSNFSKFNETARKNYITNRQVLRGCCKERISILETVMVPTNNFPTNFTKYPLPLLWEHLTKYEIKFSRFHIVTVLCSTLHSLIKTRCVKFIIRISWSRCRAKLSELFFWIFVFLRRAGNLSV